MFPQTACLKNMLLILTIMAIFCKGDRALVKSA